MSTHTVEATGQLSDLIDRAQRGDEVLITRHGEPVARISPVATETRPDPAERPVSAEAVDWLVANRVRQHPGREDAGSLLSRLRDEGEH